MKYIKFTIQFLALLSLLFYPYETRASLLDDLQGYWTFDTDGTDSTANNNDLTNNNSVGFTTGILNNASNLEKDTPSWFSLADASQTGLDITGDLSINMWV